MGFLIFCRCIGIELYVYIYIYIIPFPKDNLDSDYDPGKHEVGRLAQNMGASQSGSSPDLIDLQSWLSRQVVGGTVEEKTAIDFMWLGAF